MRKILAAFFLFFLSLGAYSQALDCKLIGEGNGDVVRLKWVPYAWPQNLEGFLVKRRSIRNGSTSDWMALHTQIIYPELSSRKELSNVEPSVPEQKRLTDKLIRLIAQGNAREVSKESFNQEILNDPTQLKNLRVGFIVDYDFVLLQGFGLIDRNMQAGQTYEYGLFAKYTGASVETNPVGTYTWQYGTRPDLSLKTEAKIRRAGRKGAVEVIWKINTEEMKSKNIAGFFIYKKNGNGEYEKKSNSIQFLSLANKTEQLIYSDMITDENSTVSYAAVPVSVMGSEGDFMEISYSKNNLEVSLTAPVLGYMNSLGQEEKPLLGWTFSNDDESYIKGFILERKLTTAKSFEKVSDLIGKEQRSYTDQTIDKKGLYAYRLVLLKNDNSRVEGESTEVNYTFTPKPSTPTNLNGKYIPGADQDYIELTWSAAKSAEVNVDQYRVYMGNPSDSELYDDATFPLITGTSCKIKVGTYQRGQWKFALTAVGSNGKESEQTKMITVFAPSKTIAPVNNTYLQITNNQAKITWVYYGDNIPDLAGFRMYQDGQLVADETVLTAVSKEWTSKALEKGKKYKFEIVALTTYGVISDKRSVQADIK